MKPAVDTTIQDLLNEKIRKLGDHFNADVINYFGPIFDGNETLFLRLVEALKTESGSPNTLYIILTTQGGSAIAVERYVNIIRHHYSEVNFIVPDYAYSAGTIFCMSGDNIYMDYCSVLGPIDPQVQNKEGKWVAALGYLDKVNEMISKAKNNELTDAEFLILREIDLAELRGYEQAKELTITLLKNWLVKYKFKNWNSHQTSPELIGKPVTNAQKEKRAEQIADILSDNKTWKSHSRPIDIGTLTTLLKLKIEDYSVDMVRRELIRSYYELMSDYVIKNRMSIFVQTKIFI